jgi:hypothetical protein
MMTTAPKKKRWLASETLQMNTISLAAKLKRREQARKAGKGTKDVAAI